MSHTNKLSYYTWIYIKLFFYKRKFKKIILKL